MNVIEWLLDSDPSIRWQVMRDLTHEPDAVVAAERSRVAVEGWGARLLGLQAPDGNWGGGPWVFQSWASTMETLVLLRELGLDPASPQAGKATGLVRDKSDWGPYHGHSPFFEGEDEPCINGRVLACGAYFGQVSDRLVDRLLSEQLQDGGWNCEAPPSKRSSFDTTICVLAGLTIRGSEVRSGGFSSAGCSGGSDRMTDVGLPPAGARGVLSPQPARAPSEEDVRRIAELSDPVVRNLQITQAYHELSGVMARLTGPGANWCTVATWASKQAGQSIRREDLVVAFYRLLRDTPEAEESAGALLQAAGLPGGDEALTPGSVGGAVEVLWKALSPSEAFSRTSDAVARGNRKVFEEIGALFARFLALCPGGPPSEPDLRQFIRTLKPGTPPGGQQYLRQAFEHYNRAIRSEDQKEKAELLLLANLEIGFHEQTRLQPQIVEAMNAPVVDPKTLRRRLVEELFPDGKSRIRYWLARLAGRMGRVLQARDRLAEEAQRAGRLAITGALMTLTLPGERVLWLGSTLPDRYPDLLAAIDLPDLLAVLQVVGPGQDDRSRTPVSDWGDLPQRMRFIADLFRTYHLLPVLFDPPFTDDQVAAIQQGRRPDGPL